MRHRRRLAARVLIPLLVLPSVYGFAPAQVTSFNLNEATVAEMQAAMESGLITSEYLVSQYTKRIGVFDDNGPMLNSVLSLNPNAGETARALDLERSQSGPRGPLHGIPVLLKDNIDTFDMPTTGGALILKDSIPPDDAFITRKLRDAGAIILGKANLSELANWVSFDLPNGFSAVGGQTLNPYGPGDLDPFGSSSGSAVAVAANLAALAIGTETMGSIVSPAWINSVVGLRPTRGLVSRDGIIPIAESNDTAGPITRSVADAATLLGVMTGVDPQDPVTSSSEGKFFTDYTQFLNEDGLQGKRLGVVRQPFLVAPDFIFEDSLAVVETAIIALEGLGATIVDDLDISEQVFAVFDLWGDPSSDLPDVLSHEFVNGIEAYFESLGDSAPVKTLAEMIAFNEANAAEAIPFGQSILVASLATGGDLMAPEYLEELEPARQILGTEAFDALMETNDLDALVFAEAWSFLGATPGYPSIVVPAGYNESGAPVSIDFLAGPYSEPTLIEIAYAFERGTQLRVPPATAPAIAGDLVPEPDPMGMVLIGFLALSGMRQRRVSGRPLPLRG